MSTPSTPRPNPIPADQQTKYPRELQSRIKAMISGQLDHPCIQAQLTAGASQVVLDIEAAKRVQWALMFSQLTMARMFIGFLGYKLNFDSSTKTFKLEHKTDEDWGYRQKHDDWKGKGAADISVKDIVGQAPPDTPHGHEQAIEDCLLLAHKIIHLAYHEPHDATHEGEEKQTKKVDEVIPVVVKLLQQFVYKPLEQEVPLPNDYRDVMDKELPGWDA